MADFASVMQKVDGPQQPQQPDNAGRTVVDQQQQQNLKLYKSRWIILFVYMVYSMANAVHWIQYSIISNITVKFYGVSNFAIDTTSTIYMIVYVPLVIPASWVLDRLVSGFRRTATHGPHRVRRLCTLARDAQDDFDAKRVSPRSKHKRLSQIGILRPLVIMVVHVPVIPVTEWMRYDEKGG
jgi:hypothetical protein